MSATWSISFDDAMAEAKRSNICAEDAAEMWGKYTELGEKVRAGEVADADALKTFGAFCKGLATIRALRTVMSPDLDVITGKLR
jgi:hypothetical protein